MAKRSLDELELTMAEIARHVGVTTSSIAKAVLDLKKMDNDDRQAYKAT